MNTAVIGETYEAKQITSTTRHRALTAIGQIKILFHHPGVIEAGARQLQGGIAPAFKNVWDEIIGHALIMCVSAYRRD